MSLRRLRRGGNAIEFAILMPFLFALLTAIMDYGWVVAARHSASRSARAGARAGAITPQDANPDSEAVDAAQQHWVDLGLPQVPTIVAFRTGDPERMTVRVTLDVTTLVGFVPGPSQISVVAVEQMEEQP